MANSPLTKHYGDHTSQVGELYLPSVAHPAIVCLLHGGFWRMPYGHDQMIDIAQDLIQRDFAVWNLEYRRLGELTGGWPSTFDDVMQGVNHLVELVTEGIDLNLENVALVGHSAGGHLALWVAGNNQDKIDDKINITAVVGQAPIANLVDAHNLKVGGSTISELLGGTPQEFPERYTHASPHTRFPVGIPQLLMHGTADTYVPISLTRNYVEQVQAMGEPTELIELVGMGHMEYLDPASQAHARLCHWLSTTIGAE